MSANSNPTQCEIILRALQEQGGGWVPMPVLAGCSGAYAVHSRIAELRRRGHAIDCRVAHHAGHTKHSLYRLRT